MIHRSHSHLASPVAWLAKPYPEIVDIAENDGSVLIVPVGSLEQHGYHLPVATDTLLATAVAHAAAEDVHESLPVLVTPPIWSGCSPHHLPFGATISLETATLLEVLSDVAGRALENGFDALLFLNGHGGNMPVISSAVSDAGHEHPDREVLGLSYFHLARAVIDEVRESDPGGISHGGEFETSLMMHLYPELVDETQLEGTQRDEPYDLGRQDLFADGPLSVYRTFDEYSHSGAIGAPELATAEKGKRLFVHIETELSDLLSEIHTQNSTRK
ncbi:creatininase family protein [Halalkalicoccus sp. NIPERK01]|uniref:creatininase family protein n=1 Tax=Halalkalicoccus sp. NIPERK01 TaxID=3053469 RepID=UPI00256ECADB|nr:creatininase family protein [Halalkalicoccus sp. NIPERK01]MDL5363406.1 creatininase family protein [Halalkalicoccus sp. NIPERK01]